ncbi:hexokinase [Clostridia bacterium]|nr:hexokinase [Clostridia bacterium]
MNKATGKISDFCARHGLYTGPDRLEVDTDRFIEEMVSGMEGVSSIKMLPAYIDPSVKPDFSKKVIVVDAGGTNLRIALVSFPDGTNPDMEYFENYPMLGTNGEITAAEFFDGLADCLAPIIYKADKIGLCFSFPAQILPNRDARILHFTKEVKVSGAEGLLVGEGLLDALKAKGLPHNKTVTVINDTVAALLGGVAGTGGRVFDGYIGVILGTGTNTAYVEQNRSIKKDAALARLDGKTVINLESGGYSKAARGDIDIAFDDKTDFPDEQMFEKMISGAYTGGLFLAFLKAAAAEDCFSAVAKSGIGELLTLSGKDIDQFCDYPYGQNVLSAIVDGDEDREALYALADAFFERVAILITTNLAALLKKTDAGQKPYKPVCISAEGTAFYKAKLFRPKLDYYMETFVKQKLGCHYEFVKIENSTILGTAAAGLLG